MPTAKSTSPEATAAAQPPPTPPLTWSGAVALPAMSSTAPRSLPSHQRRKLDDTHTSQRPELIRGYRHPEHHVSCCTYAIAIPEPSQKSHVLDHGAALCTCVNRKRGGGAHPRLSSGVRVLPDPQAPASCRKVSTSAVFSAGGALPLPAAPARRYPWTSKLHRSIVTVSSACQMRPSQSNVMAAIANIYRDVTTKRS